MGKIKKKTPKYLKCITEYNISHCSCNNCPAKLFYDNEDKPINEGLGFINSDTIIVLPTYISTDEDKFCQTIDIIKEAYKKKYDLDALNYIYITPSIKCYYKSIAYNITDAVLEKCAIKTISEIARHNHKKIIFIGNSRSIEMYLPTNNFIINYVSAPYHLLDDDIDKETFINSINKYL